MLRVIPKRRRIRGKYIGLRIKSGNFLVLFAIFVVFVENPKINKIPVNIGCDEISLRLWHRHKFAKRWSKVCSRSAVMFGMQLKKKIVREHILENLNTWIQPNMDIKKTQTLTIPLVADAETRNCCIYIMWCRWLSAQNVTLIFSL